MDELNVPSPSSRKIIVAIAMAVVVGIGTATFALRAHHAAALASTTPAAIPAVPDAVAPTPDAASPVAQTPAVPDAVAQIPDLPTSAAQRDRLGATAGNTTVATADDARPATVKTKSAGNRPVAKAHPDVGTGDRSVTHAGSAADSSKATAAAVVAGRVDAGDRVDVPTMPSAPSGIAANAPDVATSTEPVAPAPEPAATDIDIASPPR
jgi:hypothetical protein